MMYLSRLRHHGSALAGRLVSGNSVKVFLCGNEFSHSSGFSTDRTVARKDGIFASHTIFKGKAALCLAPLGPKIDKIDAGLIVKKAGRVMLTFWPAIGTRKYDWQKRQVFALSPFEVGSLISLGPDDSLEFCHDTSKMASNSSDAMKHNTESISRENTMKRLSVSPLSVDVQDQGHMFILSTTNNILRKTDRFSVPVTKGEFAVIRTACSYILPHIMGWDLVTSHPVSAYPAKYNKTLDSWRFAKPELEWER